MGSGQLLVVDPSAETRAETVAHLERAGVGAAGVGSGEAALAWMEAAVPLAVLSEVELPDMEADWLLHRVRHRAATCGVPFYFLTASARLAPTQARRLGADDLLRKPASPPALAALARTVPHADGQWHGRLEEVPLADLLALLLAGVRSATLHLRDGEGVLAVSEGRVVAARFRGREGERAFLRLLTLDAGSVTLTGGAEPGGAPLSLGLEAVEGPGAAHRRRWRELTADLPPLHTRLTVTGRAEALSGSLESLVALFDGHRTLEEVVDASPFGDVTTLRGVRRLLEAGAVDAPRRGDPEAEAARAGWFEDAEPGHVPEVDRLMTLLAGVRAPAPVARRIPEPPPAPALTARVRPAPVTRASVRAVTGLMEQTLRLASVRRWTLAAAGLCLVALGALGVWALWSEEAGRAPLVAEGPAEETVAPVVPVSAPAPVPAPAPGIPTPPPAPRGPGEEPVGPPTV